MMTNCKVDAGLRTFINCLSLLIQTL